MQIIIWEKLWVRHSKDIQVAAWIYKSLIAKSVDGIILKMNAASPI